MTKRYSQFLPGTVKKASERAADLLLGHANAKNNNKIVDMKND
jgi:hypothetical protein